MSPGQWGAVSLVAPHPGGAVVVDECRGVLEKHARSFSAAAVFLTPQMRDDAAVAYAFCRIVDDAVDEAESEFVARRDLALIEAMLNGETESSPIVAAYVDLCCRRGIGLSPARDLIRGAKTDLGIVRIEDDEDFLLYCYRVAGTVGLMMCGILGVTKEQARRHAIDLGIAMQITNICRDVLEDAGRNRVYLPGQRLRRRGVDPDQVADIGLQAPGGAPAEKVRLAISEVVSELLHQADHFYRSGAAGFVHIPRRPRLAITVARCLYREIGVTLRAQGCDPLRGRVHVKPLRKLVLTARSAVVWFLGMFSTSNRVAPASESLQLPQQ